MLLWVASRFCQNFFCSTFKNIPTLSCFDTIIFAIEAFGKWKHWSKFGVWCLVACGTVAACGNVACDIIDILLVFLLAFYSETWLTCPSIGSVGHNHKYQTYFDVLCKLILVLQNRSGINPGSSLVQYSVLKIKILLVPVNWSLRHRSRWSNYHDSQKIALSLW